MAALFKRLFDIERQEMTRALLMFLYGFLLLSAYLILKPVRNSLFLNKFGADQLIYMYMIIAATATPIAWLYGWTAARTTLPRLVGGTTILLVLNMVIFWWLIQQQYDWLIYVFYVWVSLFGVFTTSQYWLLANYVFDTREAKRLFAFIGAGAIIGGISGSVLTSQLAELVGTENLLWLCMAFMLICLAILRVVWTMRQGDDPKQSTRKKKSKELKGMLPIIVKSRHLRLLAMMIGITVIVSTFVDFQFNKVVAGAFDDKDELTAFFGTFFLVLSVVSLLLQLLFSSRIIRRFGIGTAILFLPIGLLLGSAAIFLWPVLASAMVVKISDGSFRYSINKTGLELLYLPVPTAIKGRVKALMDVVGDRLARGLGGAMLYLVNDLLQWPIQWISFLSAPFIALWIVLAVMLKREYSRTFRKTLTTRGIDTAGIQSQIRDGASIEAMAQTLRTGDRKQILFILELLAEEKDERLAEPLAELLTHESAEVRKQALKRLVPISDADLQEKVTPLLKDPEPSVRTEAVRYMCFHAEDGGHDLLSQYLGSSDLLLVSAAARCALEYSSRSGADALLTPDHFERVLQSEPSETIEAREQLAEALSFATDNGEISAYCRRFLQDDDLRVIKAALRSAAVVQARENVPILIRYLGIPAVRGLAAKALLAYGPGIMGTLRDAMLDPNQSAVVRLRIPKVISQMPTDEAAEILFAQIGIEDALLRHVVIKGLNRMRRLRGDLPLDQRRIKKLMEAETYAYYELLHFEEAIRVDGSTDRAELLLYRALEESRKRHLDQVFRLAGLCYALSDMRYAYRGVVSNSRVARSRAVEFLDTIWEHQDKQLIFPILERDDNLLETGRRLLRLKPVAREEAFRLLLVRPDQWLAACTANVLAGRGLKEFEDDLRPLSRSPHLALSETARNALNRLKSAD